MRCKKINMQDWLERVYLKHRSLLSVLISIIVTTLFHYGVISNIRENISNIIDLTAALLVIVTLILTLLMYLNDKEEYRRKIEKYKEENRHIYLFTFEISIANILSTCILITVSILNIKIYFAKLIIAFVGSYLFSYMMLGAIYMLWFTIYIVVGLNINKGSKRIS